MSWFHATFTTLTVILLCTAVHSSIIHSKSNSNFVNVWANILGRTSEDAAWDFLGVSKCLSSGWQCTPGAATSKCFQGIKDVCNGVTQCACDTNSPDCFDDESEQACETKDQVEWLMKNGIPQFGYQDKDTEIFQMLWILGLTDSLDCPTSKGNMVRTSGLSCPDQPDTCITVDQFCDGVEHCANLCYSMWGFQLCGTNSSFGGCFVKDMMATVIGGVERKRRGL